MIAEGDLVATRWSYEGKHVGEFLGQKPTGRTAKGDVHSIDRIVNGKIVEEWVQFDTANRMTAFGHTGAGGASVTPPTHSGGWRRGSRRAIFLTGARGL